MAKLHSPIDVTLAAAETIMRRVPVVWWGLVSQSPSAHGEITRMMVEKHMAFAEGVFAVQMELIKLATRPWWTARLPHETVQDMTHAAMAPASRRVKANALRLRHL